jgi:hypothetical protein
MRLVTGLLALVLPLFVVAPLCAADDIEVRSAAVALHVDILEFTIRADYPADEDMRAALEAGATVDLGMQASIDKTSQYWFDENVLKATMRRELSWDAPSRRFVLKDIASSEQRTFATLEEALVAAGTVDNWQVQLDKKLDPRASYAVSVRARLRQGRLSSALRALTTIWTRYWDRSEWYTWALPR